MSPRIPARAGDNGRVQTYGYQRRSHANFKVRKLTTFIPNPRTTRRQCRACADDPAAGPVTLRLIDQFEQTPTKKIDVDALKMFIARRL